MKTSAIHHPPHKGFPDFLKIFILILLVFPGIYHPVFAKAAQNITADILIGFDGHCKFGRWVPIHVVLQSEEAEFSGTLLISYSHTEVSLPVELSPGAQKSFSTQLFINDKDVNQEAVFSLIPEEADSGQILLETRKLNCSSGSIIGVITDTPSAFLKLNALQPRNSSFITFLSPETFPKNSIGLQSLDALFIANTYSDFLGYDQIQAVKLWTAQGGHLIFGGGAQWGLAAAGFEDVLPYEITGSKTIELLSGFSIFDPDFSLDHVVLVEGTLPEGSEILLSDHQNTLVSQRPLGSGYVSMLSFDPNISGFRNWGQAGLFYDYLLQSVPENFDLGLISDWHSAIEAAYIFQNQELPAPWMVLAILGIYVLLLGPTNFWALRKVGKPEWAWVTIPLIAVILSGIFMSMAWDFRGTKSQINQLAVVNQYADHDQAYVNGFVGVFTPMQAYYQLEVEAGFSPYSFPPHNFYDTPNNQWDFLYANKVYAGTDINPQEIMPLGVIGQVPALPIITDLDLVLDSSTAVLQGEVENSSPIDLQNLTLIYPGGFELIGDLPAAASLPIEIAIDLSSQKSANAKEIFLSNVYKASTYYGAQLQDQINPKNISSKIQTQKQIDLIEAVLGNISLPPVGFLLVAWDDSHSPYQISLVDTSFDTEIITAYTISLNVNILPTQNQLVIPPALFNWFVTESSSLKFSTPYELRFAYLDDVEIYYRLSQPIPFSSVSELILHLEGSSSRQDFPLDVFLWNYTLGEWENIQVTDWFDILIPNPQNYVEENTSEVRVRINENGGGGGIVNVSRVDISLVVEP